MASIVKRLDTGATLRSLAVGETLDIPFRECHPNSIVSAVWRTNKAKLKDVYKAEIRYKEFKTVITRLQ